MAEFRLALGGVIDAVTTKELKDCVTGLQGHIDSKFHKNAVHAPIRRTISGSFSGTLVANVPQIVTLGISKPPMGRIWNVARLTVVGNDDHTSEADLTVAMYQGDPTIPALGQLVVPGISIPYYQTFSRHSIWVHDTEDLFFNAVSASGHTNQNLVINVTVSEFWDPAVDQQYA